MNDNLCFYIYVFVGKVFWEAQDATKLGILSAATNNILALTQTLITAMVSGFLFRCILIVAVWLLFFM